MELAQYKPKTVAALIAVGVSTLLGIYSVWAIILVGWTLSALRQRSVELVETIYADQNPVLFWLIVVMWILFGLSLILVDLAWMTGMDVSYLYW